MASPTSPDITLHTYWRSSCSYRVRLILALKGLAYASVPVHLLKEGGQQLQDGYAALNPMREVPTLLMDGLVLTQSSAIAEYLEEARPGLRPLLPPLEQPGLRAHVRALCAIISNDMQPLGNLHVLKHVAATLQAPDSSAEALAAAKTAWARHFLARGFAGLEALLAQKAGKFSVGDSVTLADVFLVPQCYNAVRFGLDLSAYPTVARVSAALAELPEFVAAHPAQQPDAEQ
jgi:maleylacetoacetate isomerase